MLDRQNKIAGILTWIGFIEIAAGFILGIVLGREDVGYLYESYEQVWSVTLIWWIGGFVSGMFIIGISEIIEQLHKLNSKSEKVQEDEDLELIK